MIVYEGTKADFLVSVEADTIAVEIENNIYYKMNRHTAKNEFRSWESSLEYMYKVLNDHDIPKNAGVAIEYNIPQTSKRVDFLISGYDEKQNENVIIIELKQWDKLEEVEGCDGLVETFTGNRNRKVVHPSINHGLMLCLLQIIIKMCKKIIYICFHVLIYIIIEGESMTLWMQPDIKYIWKMHRHLQGEKLVY